MKNSKHTNDSNLSVQDPPGHVSSGNPTEGKDLNQNPESITTDSNNTTTTACIFDGLTDLKVYQLVTSRGHAGCECSGDPDYEPVFDGSYNVQERHSPFSAVFAARANHLSSKLPLLRSEQEYKLHAELTSQRDEARKLKKEEKAKNKSAKISQTISQAEIKLAEQYAWHTRLCKQEDYARKALDQKWDDIYEQEIESLLETFSQQHPVWWANTVQCNHFLTPAFWSNTMDTRFIRKWGAAVRARQQILIAKS